MWYNNPRLFLLRYPTTNLRMPSIEYRRTDIREIDCIRPLWCLLNDFMSTQTTNFRSHFEQMTFEKRMDYFEHVAAARTLCIDLAFDLENSNRYVGYCVSSLSQEKTGEIESIFVDEIYRSCGIGSALVTRALVWLDENGSTRNRVSVSEGNEPVWNFYKKFKFYPRMTVLEQKKG
jgi:ribosomal protein S18 acetylase RimI-like enzyme